MTNAEANRMTNLKCCASASEKFRHFFVIRHSDFVIFRMTKTQKRLLLFDIDGTLIHSGGAGVQALKLAFKERFGIDDDLHDIEIAGMTDSGIVLSILKK